MVTTAHPQLVLVHGIGGLRNAETERRQWLKALATGVRAAGQPELVSALTQGWLADVRFADYSDLFTAKGAQGGALGEELDPFEEQVLAGLLGRWWMSSPSSSHRIPVRATPGSSNRPGTS
jgi:hypothetical protein